MNTPAVVDRFCESRHRWLIVTGATFLASLVTILPQADQYLTLRADEDEKTEELDEARQTAQMLAGLRDRVVETTSELEALERRTLPEEAVSDFRNQLVEMVRESGCQVRRIGVGGVRVRQWRENDRPLAEPSEKAGPDTPFQLETRAVSLSVTGSMTEVRELLGKIESNGMMNHAKGLDLRPAGRGGRVQMELELWCFALTRGHASA
ncbi:MAG: hypothetical protein AAGB00_03605 [Planctomycetota bacterium]